MHSHSQRHSCNLGWDAVADTIHDALLGFIDLARAREAKLEERQDDVDVHVDLALNRLARASSFETRSTPPRGREIPSRLNASRLTCDCSWTMQSARLIRTHEQNRADERRARHPKKMSRGGSTPSSNRSVVARWCDARDAPAHVHLEACPGHDAGALCAWVFGPDDVQYRMFAVSLALLTVLGGSLRNTTKEGGLMGEMATAAMSLLLLAPAVGIRASRVADAVFTANHIAPNTALFQLPAIAQTVPLASGPLLIGAGLAIVTICGRLGAVYAGIAFGAALAAWVGQTLAIEAEVAMISERFEDAVLYSQAMRFVGLSVLVGAIAGFPFYQQGKRAWREAMRALIHDQRMAEAEAARAEEIARVQAAHAELKAREAAEEAKRAKEEEEASQGVVIAGFPRPSMMRKSVQPTIPRSSQGEGSARKTMSSRRTRIRTTMKATTPAPPPRTERETTRYPKKSPSCSRSSLSRASTSSHPSSSRSPTRSRTPIVT